MNRRDVAERAADMRRAFDATFARAPETSSARTEDFLLVHVAGDPFAMRVADFARVAGAPKIVAVPSRSATVIGVASMRGAIVSVHSLARLLGYDAPLDGARWIALARAADTIGFAFAALDRFARVESTEERVLVTDGVARPIVDVAALVAKIKAYEKTRREA